VGPGRNHRVVAARGQAESFFGSRQRTLRDAARVRISIRPPSFAAMHESRIWH